MYISVTVNNFEAMLENQKPHFCPSRMAAPGLNEFLCVISFALLLVPAYIANQPKH